MNTTVVCTGEGAMQMPLRMPRRVVCTIRSIVDLVGPLRTVETVAEVLQ